MFLDNDPKGQGEACVRLDILRSAIGDARHVQTLTRHDVQQYEARRKKGGIRYGEGRVTPPVGQRSVQADVKLLEQVLGWGCTVASADGTPLLERHPLERIGVKGEHDPRTKYGWLIARASVRSRRLDAVRGFGLNSAWSCWKAPAVAAVRSRDSGGLTSISTQGESPGAASTTRSARNGWWPTPSRCWRRFGSFSGDWARSGGPVFPRRADPQRYAPPELLSEWILKAEAKAGLPKLEGGTTHPYRRKWKGERANHPVKAVAVAGGWTDITTMLRCYDHPDDEDVLAVTSEPRKWRDASLHVRAEASM